MHGEAAQDYRNIEQDVYKLPWDMTTSGHRQWSPFWVAQRTAQVSAKSLQVSLQCHGFTCCNWTAAGACHAVRFLCGTVCKWHP